MMIMTIKRAMVFSLVLILAGLMMLFTTTYAWFIDSQESVDNTITAGTLDVVMTATAANGDAIDLATDKAIYETNWQPSDSNAVAITITNNGTLDLKFDLLLTVEDTAPLVDLSPAIWYVATSGASLPTAGTPYTVIAEPASPVFMNAYVPVTGVTLAAGNSITYRVDYGFLMAAGNEYQGGLLNVSIKVQAYQTMAP